MSLTITHLKIKNFILVCVCSLVVFPLFAQDTNDKTVYIGAVAQQTLKLYNENGLSLMISSPKFMDNGLFVNFSVISSRIGSAYKTNAIKQDNFVLGAHYHFFRKNKLQPLIGVNTGVFVADYEEVIFNQLSSTSMLLSLETGLHYQPELPLSMKLSGGYNFISNSGTLFPVFYKLALYYRFQ